MTNLFKAMTPTLGIVIVVASIVGLAAVIVGLTKEKQPVDQAATSVDSRPAIPPIDAAAPTHTEVATFALG